MSQDSWLKLISRRLTALANQSRLRRNDRRSASVPGLVAQLERRQMLSATPVGGEVRVNTFTAGAQRTNHSGTGGSVAMDADGDFVVAWMSNGQDGSGWGVYAQRYNAAGVTQGGEFRVNTTTESNQKDSTVAMDADGDFVVTWSSRRQDNIDEGSGVYAQRYQTPSNAVDYAFSGGILTVTGTSLADNITVFNDAGSIKINDAVTVTDTGITAASVTGVSIFGLAGDDTLSLDASLGTTRLGTLWGGEGNDFLFSGLGKDTLNGGNGIDAVSYYQATAAVKVSLALATAQTTGGAGIDTLIGIENLTGSNFADTLTGSTGNNVLSGGQGNDILSGGFGADSLLGGSGNDSLRFDQLDTLLGGIGTDTANISLATAAVNLNLVTSEIETVSATTSTFNNMFDASGATWVVTITGGSGNDTLISGLMNDRLTGGAGNDTVSYAGATAAVNVSLVTKKSFGGAGIDTLATIENITGSMFNDTLIGDANDNIFHTGGGTDTITGNGGTDTIIDPNVS